MKIEYYKKTKQQQVFELMDKQGYLLDPQTIKIFGLEKMSNVSEHIRIWKKLKADKEFFAGKNIIEKRKGRRCHLVRLDKVYYKVGKEFYNSILLP